MWWKRQPYWLKGGILFILLWLLFATAFISVALIYESQPKIKNSCYSSAFYICCIENIKACVIDVPVTMLSIAVVFSLAWIIQVPSTLYGQIPIGILLLFSIGAVIGFIYGKWKLRK